MAIKAAKSIWKDKDFQFYSVLRLLCSDFFKTVFPYFFLVNEVDVAAEKNAQQVKEHNKHPIWTIAIEMIQSQIGRIA